MPLVKKRQFKDGRYWRIRKKYLFSIKINVAFFSLSWQLCWMSIYFVDICPIKAVVYTKKNCDIPFLFVIPRSFLSLSSMPAWLSHSFDLKSTRPSTKALCSNSLSLAFFSSTQKEYYSWGCLALEASKRCWHNGPFCFSTKIIEFLHENKSTIVFNRVFKVHLFWEGHKNLREPPSWFP